jgi:hypothetical protein
VCPIVALLNMSIKLHALVSIIVVILAVLVMRPSCASWVDPDTSIQAQTTRSLYKEDSRPYQLVFSDEFEQEGRTFHDGNDPRWTAIYKNDCKSNLLLM